MTQSAQVYDFLAELKKHVSGDLRTDQYSRIFYSTDASIYQVMPHGVLLPKHSDDLQAAVELAAKYKVPLLPRTAGSSLAGQATNKALVMDMSRHMDKVLEVNTEEGWVRVQPGIVLDELNLYLKPLGYQFGPDPASSNRAAMGGIVSNNSTGSHSILYGMTTDHVLEMQVILSDGTLTDFGPLTEEGLRQRQQRAGLEGEIYRRVAALANDPAKQETILAGTPRHWRRCGGYNLDRFIPVRDGSPSFMWPFDPRFNLSKLVSGAEGTLAVMTEIKLNIVPLPKKTTLAIVHFDNLPTALTAVTLMLETNPSAIELLDNLGLTMCREVPEYARLLETFVLGTPNCILITEFYGESDAELDDKVAKLEAHLRQHGVGETAVLHARTAQQQANIWTVRKVGLGLMMSIKGDRKPIPFIEDAAVPVAHLAEYVTKIERFCNDIGTDIAYYAHASAGCIHIRPLVNTKMATEIAKLPQIGRFSVDLLRGYGGALSSEHGDGKVRSWLNESFFGPDLYKLYQEVKTIFDPDNILNPGNIVNAPAMTENLRYGATYEVIPLQPKLDFSDDMGFHRAVEMCNGAGICRKKITGTMCPSFMVTREEEHSTRGRANALRNAMSGRMPATELTSQRMYEVMDLCIGCKGCKAECPSSVDMAKIKTEFLAQYYEANGTPLRAKLFGNIATLSRLSSGIMAPLANFGTRNRLSRWVMDKYLGISKERTLPPFASTPLPAWFKKHQRAADAPAPYRKVAFFHDAFINYNYPEVGIAAIELLEAAGFEVVMPGHRDDGRSFFSKGLVDEARKVARHTVSQLAPLARQGIPIVGVEPSTLLMLRDEYRYLLPQDPDMIVVAQHAYTFEEFVARLADKGELNLRFSEAPRKLLLHGHCHQKALIGTQPSHRVLTLPPNYTVEEVDSGCCGMAGSFGYEAEHYEVSMQMGERRLLTAVRSTPADTLIVAGGVSCRQQIKHGSQRQALHPAQVLRQALIIAP